jgi:hypothetical protein
MTSLELKRGGYTESTNTWMKDETGKYCKAYHFRWIQEEGLRLYQITVWEWHFEKRILFAAEARLYRSAEEDMGFDLVLHGAETMTIESMEAFFKNAFNRLECVPDVHNQR